MAKKLTMKSRVLKGRSNLDTHYADRVMESISIEPALDVIHNQIHTIPAMIEKLQSDPSCLIEARVLCLDDKGNSHIASIEKKKFLECVIDGPKRDLHFRENFFDTDVPPAGIAGNQVGQQVIPLLGGPFNKQQYIYDYLKAHMTAFYYFNHDPIARCIVLTTRDFTLGRNWRVDAKHPDPKIQAKAQDLWDATAKVNELELLMDQGAIELSLYGELMVWQLPNNRTKIYFDVNGGEVPPKGLLPRFRLIDPSVIWDIITFPEDITRVLAYQWIAPTQYQMYTRDDKTGKSVPSLKFIYQQIPADQVDHHKINVVSNEKRGRGDLYPILGYLKFMRDLVAYKVLADQKNAAWAIDTTIDGNQNDIDMYVASQQELGTIPNSASEFVHSKKVTREYRSNNASKGTSSSFEETANLIAAGCKIPVHYFGFNTNSGSSRASSMVATEPVTKHFEMRQQVYSRVLTKMFDRTMKQFGLDVTCEVTMPELVIQDRSAKLADLALAEDRQWLSHDTIVPIVAQELAINGYDPDDEERQIKKEQKKKDADALASPLTMPAKVGKENVITANQVGSQGAEKDQTPSLAKPKGMTQDDKRGLRLGRGK